MIITVEDISCHTREDYIREYLSADRCRKAKADAYAHDADRRRCIFAYSLAKRTAARVLGKDITLTELENDDSGRPYIAGETLGISMSHSGDFVACAVDKGAVGVDIEAIREISLSRFDRICTKRELVHIFGTAEPQAGLSAEQLIRFYSVWTAKEAYLKLTGSGISGGLLTAEVYHDYVFSENARFALTRQVTEQYVLSAVADKTAQAP